MTTKRYVLKVEDVCDLVVVDIDRETAKSLIQMAALVKAFGIFPIEKSAHQAVWLHHPWGAFPADYLVKHASEMEWEGDHVTSISESLFSISGDDVVVAGTFGSDDADVLSAAIAIKTLAADFDLPILKTNPQNIPYTNAVLPVLGNHRSAA
jgi:hypothetical protein